MKKIILSLLLLLLLPFVGFAQEHLKFMGIPITGTLSSFQAKLASKGCVVDKQNNKYVPKGCRVFKGNFAGNKASIYVYYTDKNIVYRAKAVLTVSDRGILERKYSELEMMLREKYSLDSKETGEQDGFDTFTVYVSDDSGKDYLGRIDLFCSNPANVYTLYPEYTIHVDYNDYLNSKKNMDSRMDDL